MNKIEKLRESLTTLFQSDDVMLLLKLIFHRQDTQELLKKLLEREKPETP